MILWLLRRAVLLGLYFTIQYSLYQRAIRYFSEPLGGNHRRRRTTMWVKWFFIGINLPIVFVILPTLRASLPKIVATLTLYPFTIWLPSSLFIFLLLLSREAIQALTQRPPARPALETPVKVPPSETTLPASPPRREFIRLASSFLVTAPIATFTYGVTISKTNFKVEHITIPIKNLPKSLEGLRICQLTDIHYESFIFPEDLEQVVKMANDLNPDLTFLTGDFLTDQSQMAEPFIEVFRGLKAKEGIFGCFGNHENYTRTHDIFTRGFRQGGIEMLRDEITNLRLRGETIQLAGIDWVGRKLRPEALQIITAMAQESPSILLSHQPNMFPFAAAAGVDLTVSGHTHGGQIALELGAAKLSIAHVVTPYNAGLYQQGASHLYVSRGIGTVALPLRLNAPPEITLMRLVCA